MRTICLLILGLNMVSTTAAKEPAHASVWFGTRGSAIYRADLNLETGILSAPEVAAEIEGPGFLAIDQAEQRLYSLGRVDGREGNVAAFEITTDNKLQLLSTADSGGGKPTHISLSRDEGTLLLAHYGGGSVATVAVIDDGRSLKPTLRVSHSGSSVNPERQDKPHPHWIGATPDNGFVFVPDLGTDEILIYRFDQKTSRLEPHASGKVPPGSGPRHLKFHPNGRWVYVINEMSLTVTAFHYDSSRGTLEPFQTIPAVALSDTKVDLNAGSEIRIHPNGRFLYAGIRGHDVIAVLAIDPQDGTLDLVEQEPIRGSWPRNFNMDPSGTWLLAAGAESNTVAVFQVNPDTGQLVFTRQVINVPAAICVEFTKD